MKTRMPKEGFTLIELSLSMVFLSILSLLIVFIIGDTVASYRRGLTVSQINTVGIEVVDDMRTAIQNASSAPVTNLCEEFYANNSALQAECLNDDAFNFVSIERKANVKVNGQSIGDVPVYGAFCTGTYSFIWNSGYFESSEAEVSVGVDPAYLVYMDGYGTLKELHYSERDIDGSKPFRLLKVRDANRAICTSVVRPYNATTGEYAANYNLPTVISNRFDISGGFGTISEEPVDAILADSYNDLSLYSLDIARPAQSTTQKNAFYSVSFILGTLNGGINIKATDKKCATPNDYAVENYDYCAINKFNFAVQANGE